MWEGVEHADSLIVNAHKWLGAVFDCTLYFVRDPEHLVRVMSTNPSYLQTAADGRVKNYRDWGLPLGRRFRALEVVVPDSRAGCRRIAGAPAPRHRQRRSGSKSRSPRRPTGGCSRRCRCRRCACVTSRLGSRRGARRAHAQDWAARLNQSGEAYVTPAMLDGRWMVRVSIGAELTEREHVEQLWALMRERIAEAETEDDQKNEDTKSIARSSSILLASVNRRPMKPAFDIINPATSAVLDDQRRTHRADERESRRSSDRSAAFASWKAKTAFERSAILRKWCDADPRRRRRRSRG